MKLIWGKIGNEHAFAVLPRAELTPEEQAAGKGGVLVDLGRSKSGKCIYPLEALAAHDGHAPRWNADGTAPAGSTAPDTTADSYRERVQKDIVEQGVEITLVEEKVIELPTPSYDAEGKATPPQGEGWKKYGVDPEEVN